MGKYSGVEFIGEYARQRYGISQDFADMIDAIQGLVTVIDALREGIEVSDEDIGVVVEYAAHTAGYLTRKYDPSIG